MDKDKTPKEVAFPLQHDNLNKIVIESLVLFRLPVIVSLVHRDDETSVCTTHKVYETKFVALHKYPDPVEAGFA